MGVKKGETSSRLCTVDMLSMQVETGYDCEGGDAATQDTCTPTCGDGVLKGAENCDDGNTADDDG